MKDEGLSDKECGVAIERMGKVLQIRVKGEWRLKSEDCKREEVNKSMEELGIEEVKIIYGEVKRWDSRLLGFVRWLKRKSEEKGVVCQLEGFPDGFIKLLELSIRKKGGGNEKDDENERLGWGQVCELLCGTVKRGVHFVGEVSLSGMRLMGRKRQFFWEDFLRIMQEAGAEALPIISLIAFLVGFIMAFVGAIQLKKFGAMVYVADLVTLGMVREMGAMITAIIMCGRTGAAYAATLGTMKVNEEIDALKMVGVNVMDFLVLPRVLGLFLMMPLLCIYGNLVGIVGGGLVTNVLFDVTWVAYWNEVRMVMGNLGHVVVGLIKATVFGVLVAMAGCYKGLESGRDASAVGQAATGAVVLGLVLIVVADALFAVIFNAVGL